MPRTDLHPLSAGCRHACDQSADGNFGKQQKSRRTDSVNATKKPLANLYQLLESASLTSKAMLTIYPSGKMNPCSYSYHDLLVRAQRNTEALLNIDGIASDSKILLHFDQHSQSIEWFWTAIAAGYLPAMSPPTVNDVSQRRKHLIHVHQLLESPIILTTAKLVSEFHGLDQLNIRTVESLKGDNSDGHPHVKRFSSQKQRDDLAVLMLTSGSTGNAKAVSLTHGQLLIALEGKREYNETTSSDVFLNWIGMDHVAGLSEVHLHATSMGAEQVHVQAADLLMDPLYFLDIIHKHRVTYTFAPNFFLAALNRSLDALDLRRSNRDFDLSCLRIIQTGGEAAVVETCRALAEHLRRFGVAKDRHVIRPGFGMTETCAGSIYHKLCPTYDLRHSLEFAALGSCMPGIEMRIINDNGTKATANEIGDLQLSGPVLFTRYFNNKQATLDAFTNDGWFITGDRAMMDANDYLSLAGRLKENIIINGVKYFPHELETALEGALIPGITASYNVVISYRPKCSDTETVCVLYLPTFDLQDGRALSDTADAITKVCGMVLGVKPYEIVPLEKLQMPKSSLGKISRARIHNAFRSGVFAEVQNAKNKIIREYRTKTARQEKPSTDLEAQILEVFVACFKLPTEEVGLDSSVFDVGVTSMDLIRFTKKLKQHLALDTEIPLGLVLISPTIRSLASALKSSEKPAYDPVVTLQAHGNKIPLWLVHPGVGEVLVFLNLSKYITDRPVYALRARGFDEGETFFESIPEVISTYYQRIKKVQPNGPYGIAGYSFGAMLAFEISKLLEIQGDEVRFLGSFNLPPHIKSRMLQLNWTEALLNLSYFLDLIAEDYAREISGAMHAEENRDKVLDRVMQSASLARLEELSLSRQKLATWASLAHAMQQTALDYEPTGSVASIDVFMAVPLVGIAKNKVEWYEKHLCHWENFSRTKPRYHDVDGAHYTMMNSENVNTFQKKLRSVLKERRL